MAFISRFIRHLLTALSLLTIGLKAQADEPGWALTQRSVTMGDQYVYVSPSGIKIQSVNQGMGTIVRAPNWDAIFFNNQTKLYYQMGYQQWKTRLAGNKGRIPAASWTQGRSGLIAGLRATEYVMKNAATAKKPNDWVSAQYWVANDIKINPKLSELLSTAYGTPDNSCVPLRLVYKTASGKTGVSLDTSAKQVTTIPSGFFNGPAGFQLAKSEVDVMMSNENRQIMDDIANDLGKTDTDRAASHIPAAGVKLPNGKTVSKEQISRFVDAFKSRQSGPSGPSGQ